MEFIDWAGACFFYLLNERDAWSKLKLAGLVLPTENMIRVWMIDCLWKTYKIELSCQ